MEPSPRVVAAERNVSSKSERLAVAIHREILSERLGVGVPLGTKSELAKRHDVAPGTLNEALRMLQARGVVNLRPGPNGGAFVALAPRQVQLRDGFLAVDGDPEQLEHCIAVRDELETLVTIEAALACRAADRKRLAKALAAIEEAQEFWGRTQAVWQLHREIAATGRNKVLTAVYVGLVDTIERLLIEMRRGDSPGLTPRVDSTELHRELVQAITDRDVERARSVAHRHTPLSHD